MTRSITVHQICLSVILGLASFQCYAIEGTSPLGDVVRNTDGNVSRMNQVEAKRVCIEKNLRLPTARELAIHAQTLGARGIRETKFPDAVSTDAEVKAEIEQMRLDGYHPIFKINSSTRMAVDFYYENGGYNRPEGDHGQYSFWSSSLILSPPRTIEVYSLNGYDGAIQADVRGNPAGAVRCVDSR